MARRRSARQPLFPLLVVGFLGLGGCMGVVGDLGGSPLEEQVENEVAVIGLRRLTAQEYAATVQDLVGFVPVNVRETLPIDPLLPFDNDFTYQKASEALIQGADLLAGDVAEALVAAPALVSKVLGCAPSGPTDAACFRSLIKTFGRRVFRDPLSTTEVDKFAKLLDHAQLSGDFNIAVDSAIRAFLQHPEFLYRVEIGTPVPGTPGVSKLSDFEVATRLSYFIVGSTPEDWLLDAAESGKLSTAEGLQEAAKQLFAEDRAKERMGRFHKLWLGYSTLTNTGIFADMRVETNALISKIVFEEKRPWTDLLTSPETYLTPALAEHYGLPSPGANPGWPAYEESGRKGIRSQGTFLSAVSKLGDTSPTQRDLLVRTRLFCQVIPKPPLDSMVNIDMPPEWSNRARQGVAWHVKHWARLIQRLRDTQDSDGSPILDHTALVMAFEGGWGQDPEQQTMGEAHSSENMVVLIGGKAGGLHKTPGRHIQGNKRHPCEVVTTAMKAVGANQQLGEVSGTFEELFT